MRWLGCILTLLVIVVSCSDKKSPETQIPAKKEVESWVMPDTATYSQLGNTTLSSYGFFKGPLKDLQPGDQVFPYDVNNPLFSDYALKKRFIYLPEGHTIAYNDHDILDFPEGTILIKNFYYDSQQLPTKTNRILETRLLIKDRSTWKALPYVWNEEQTEAFLEISGMSFNIQLTSGVDVRYSIPDMTQCKGCHNHNGEIKPIGPNAAQLNKKGENGKNQLAVLQELGWLTNTSTKDKWPTRVSWADTSYSLNERARAYLDINCGHCHSDFGPAKNSGLDLSIKAPNDFHLGIFKSPIAAGKGSGGLKYDIYPGKPESSILLYRMLSNDPGIMMPELGRSVIHQEGVELIKEWIASYDGKEITEAN